MRYVRDPQALADADLVILPGSKNTLGDLCWLRRQGVKVGKIGDMRQVNHGDVDIAPVGAMVFPGLQRDAVLILEIHVKPWH
ncbi:hypothetical protein Q8G10_27685, partial [Klebsiella pneumoniae]|nr:hypothetical protein [Klebsiella pneumoniae]